jgi:hypothetical protein
MPTFYQNGLVMRNTDVTGGKPIAVRLQSISGGSTVNPFVAFYDIYGWKGEVLFFYSVPDTIRDTIIDWYHKTFMLFNIVNQKMSTNLSVYQLYSLSYNKDS